MSEEKKNIRPQLFSKELIELIGEDFANKIIDQICQGLSETPPAPTSLCLEIIIFEIEEKILKSLVKCTFANLNPILITQEIIKAIHHVNNYINENNHKKTPSANYTVNATTDSAPPQETSAQNDLTTVEFCKFELLGSVVKKIHDLQSTLLDSCNLREKLFEEILLYPSQLQSDELTNLYALINHVLIQQFRETLISQHDNFVLKLCNKISCINSDIEFVADQIKQLTINYPTGEIGIIEIADAAGSVAESFYSEKKEFNEIYDAVDEVAKIIQDLTRFYKIKLEQLQELLSLSIAGCPVPIQAKVTLPTIPEVPPPPPIISVVGLPGNLPIITP